VSRTKVARPSLGWGRRSTSPSRSSASTTPQRRAAPAGGAKRETARALHAVTSRRFKQERLRFSIGYTGAYHDPGPPPDPRSPLW
jgi:hypothetical protein